MKVHPFAERFPMLAEDQLQELAADIAEHGQVYPIMLDAEGVLLDGRNRLAACQLAKVTPKTAVWQGDDPVSYILSVNVHRRHISKSMQAMAMAIAYPDPLKVSGRREKGKSLSYVTKDKDISDKALSQARTIIREFSIDSDQVAFVMRGGSLEQTYQQALEGRRLKEEYERQLAQFKQQLEAMGTADSPTVFTDIPSINTSYADALGKDFDKDFPSLEKRLDDIKAQQTALGTLDKLRERLEAIANDAATAGPLQESLVAAVYSSINKGIANYKKIAENYQKTLQKPHIRKVK